jgi:hypothetical protein
VVEIHEILSRIVMVFTKDNFATGVTDSIVKIYGRNNISNELLVAPLGINSVSHIRVFYLVFLSRLFDQIDHPIFMLNELQNKYIWESNAYN